MAKSNEQLVAEFTPVSMEELREANGLEFNISGDFTPLLDALNERIGTNMVPREGGESLHMTLIGPTERAVLPNVSEEQLELLNAYVSGINEDSSFRITGIGFIDGAKGPDMRPVDSAKKVAFLTVECPPLQEFRRGLGLQEKDFHITLGFETGDIHFKIAGVNEKGKPVNGSIPKKPDSRYDDLLALLPQNGRVVGLAVQEKK